MAKERIKPDCLKCGICCVAFNGQDEYCDLYGSDFEKLPKQYRTSKYIASPSIWDVCIHGSNQQTIRTKRIPSTRGWVVACKMLKGKVGQAVYCLVYEDRPRSCRVALKPGDKSCKAARKMFGIDDIKKF